MRNAAFDRDRDGSGRRDRLVQEGAEVRREPWYDRAVAVLQAWCQDKFAHRDDGGDPRRLFTPDATLEAQLVAIPEIPPEWTRTLSTWPPQDPTAENPKADWIWGSALALLAPTVVADTGTFELVMQALGHAFVACEAFLVHLASDASLLDNSPLAAALARIPVRMRSLEECHLHLVPPEEFARRTKAWWANADLHDLWTRRSIEHIAISCDEGWVLDAARRADHVRYLQLLEETGNPWLVMSAFEVPDIAEDPDEILALLAAAPPAHASMAPATLAGSWNHRMTAPLLLEALAKYVAVLVRVLEHGAATPNPDLEHFLRVELPELVDRVVRVLLQRPDGRFLAVFWLVHRVHCLENETGDWQSAARNMLALALATALATQGVTRGDFDMFIPEVFAPAAGAGERSGATRNVEENGPPNVHDADAVLALVAVAAAIQDVQEAESAMTVGRLAIARLLEAPDNKGFAVPFASLVPSQRHHIVAATLLSAPDPLDLWARWWRSLAEQRRSALNGRKSSSWSGFNSSLFLLGAGIATLRRMSEDAAANPKQIVAFWHLLYDSITSVLFRLPTEQEIEVDRWRRCVFALFENPPFVGTRPAESTELTAALRALGGDEALLVLAAGALCLGGIGSAEVRQSFQAAGVDLAVMCDRLGVLRSHRTLQAYGVPPSPVDRARDILRAAGIP